MSINRIDHLAEADRLMALANSDKPMGRIERTEYITEANHHLLYALLEVAAYPLRVVERINP
jgi:hypothetical protein